MAALTADRKTGFATSDTEEYDAAASVTVFHGSMVNVDAAGNARPARANATDRCVGVNMERKIDNSTGSAGDKKVTVSKPIARYANSAGVDAITAAEKGQDCYVVDDQTVALTDADGTRPRAGKIHGVDSYGVFVDFRQDRNRLVPLVVPQLANISTGGATGSVVVPAGVQGEIVGITGKASADPGAATVLSATINGVAVTGGAVTLASGGVVADHAYPTAAKRVAPGDLVTITSDDGASNAVAAYVTLLISAE